jgi:hypothetical protein
MGIAIVKADKGKGVEFAVGHSAGEGQESIPNLVDVTCYLSGGQGIRTGRRSLKGDVIPCTVKKM